VKVKTNNFEPVPGGLDKLAKVTLDFTFEQ